MTNSFSPGSAWIRRNPAMSALAVLSAAISIMNICNALPDDSLQDILFDAPYCGMDLDSGYYVCRGTMENPARISQGSIEIAGEEITVERSEGALAKITVTGTPARFQQQPDIEKAIIHVSGKTLVFDNKAQLVTADEDAEFHQDSSSVTGFHIEYNLSLRSFSVSGRNADERARMLIPATQE